MTDPAAIVQQVMAALNGIAGVNGRVFDGDVDDSVATDSAGYPLPYVVLWAGVGDDVTEANLTAVHTPDGLVFDFQTTSVGPLPGHCRAVTTQVKDALTNLRVGTGRVKPNPDGFNQQAPIRDTNVNPHRFYLPQQWRLLTN